MHSQYRKKSHDPRIALGDVVVVHSEHQPRATWKLGVLVELLVGTDGENIAAVLCIACQRRTTKHLRCPVQKLFPIEKAVMASKQEEKTYEPKPGPEMNLKPNHKFVQ